MQETGQKAVMLSFRLPAAERDAFKAWCTERHTTVQAVLRGDVARHLTTLRRSSDPLPYCQQGSDCQPSERMK